MKIFENSGSGTANISIISSRVANRKPRLEVPKIRNSGGFLERN